MPTAGKRTTSKSRKFKSEARKKNVGIRLFEDGAEKLLVPTEGVWLFKQQRTPINTLRRADLITDEKRPRKLLEEWKRKYGEGLLDFLNGKPAPDNLTFIVPCYNRRYLEREGRVFLTPEMLRYQVAMTIKATCNYLADQGTPAGTICNILKAFAEVHWFRPWLLLNEAIPQSENVTVVSHPHMTACRNAWAYVAISESCDPKITVNDYGDWIRRFPQDELFDWLLWLYGGSTSAPDGWYIVPDWITRVRQRMSPEGIRDAAGNSSSFGQKIKNEPLLRQAFDDALAAYG